jgi:probable HAF family extracellular repeat protein
MSHLPRVAGAVALAFLLDVGGMAQQYTVTTLGNLGTVDEFDAYGGVNAFGQAAGGASTPSGQYHAFLYDQSRGGMIDLGTLGGTTSRSNYINNAGSVVGYSTVANGDIHAFIYTVSGGMQDIQSLVSLGGGQSSALAINDLGTIVGWSLDAKGNTCAFLYDPTTGRTTNVQQLLPFGGASSVAYGVNSANQIVGAADVGGGTLHAFSYDITRGAASDLGTLGGPTSIAFAINSSGLIVGSADIDTTDSDGFAVSVGSTLGSVTSNIGALGGLDSIAGFVNDAGHIVGEAERADLEGDAFLWDSVNGMRDLNNLLLGSPAWTLVEAQGISRSGLIVGYGYDPTGLAQLFLLTPQLPVISSEVSITASGLAYSRVSKTFNGIVTVTNRSSGAIAGPFQVAFSGLSAGVTVGNAAGIYNGSPYLTVSAMSLSPGMSASVSVQFNNPSNAKINFTPIVYSGSLN